MFVVGSMVVANTINTGCVDLLVIGRERPKQASATIWQISEIQDF